MGRLVQPSSPLAGASARRNSDLAKAAFIAAVVALAVWYIWANALRFLAPESAARTSYGANSAAIVVHILGGIVALMLGPLQFLDGLRRSRPRLHRIVGRIYLGAIAVAASAAIYVLVGVQRSLMFETGLYGLATAWVVTSVMALLSIRLRQIDQHREWMIRSYVVTFGFVVFRLGSDWFLASGTAPRAQVSGTMAWLCWAGPLLVTEVALQARRLTTTARAQRHRLSVTS